MANLVQLRNRPRWIAAGTAVGSVMAALLIRYWADSYFGEHQVFIVFLVSVTAAAGFAGFRYALPTLILGAMTTAWFFLPPHRSLRVQESTDVFSLAFYVVSGLLVAVLGDALRRAPNSNAESASGPGT